jgi:hypothetical protein
MADFIAAAAPSLQSVLHGYVEWALAHPERFRLVFGSWSAGPEELAAAAQTLLRRRFRGRLLGEHLPNEGNDLGAVELDGTEPGAGGQRSAGGVNEVEAA